MTLDEFQTKWAEHDRKLDSVIRLNRELLSKNSLSGARTALRRQTIFAVLSAVCSWVAIPLMGLFIAKFYAEVEFVLPAALIGAYFIASMLAHIRQVRTLAAIDYGEPIAVIQRQIEAVVRMRIRLARWIAMSMVLLWVPICIVGAKALGANLYNLAPRWLIANTLFGLAWWALIMWVSKRAAARSDSPRVQWIVREIAGDNLNSAKQFLASLTEFEKE